MQPQMVSREKLEKLEMLHKGHGMESFSTVNMIYTDGIKETDWFDKMDHSKLIFEGYPTKDIFRVNEHLSALVGIVCNCLVIAVFVRVLGLARLPSRVIVSLALSNIVFDLTVALHTTSISVTELSDSVASCRFVTLSHIHSLTLLFNGLSAAILERILACNVPAYYSCNMHILGPVILITPWAFWIINMILIAFTQFYDFDLGYQCSSHMNEVEPEYCIGAVMESAIVLVCFLYVVLGISFLLQKQTTNDVWEKNRMQFEVRTTAVILKVALLNTAFILPVACYTWWVQSNGISSDEYINLHLLGQFTGHIGVSLIIVLMSRQEFRKNLPLIFESKSAITKTRTQNLLIHHPSSDRPYSARNRRLSDLDKSGAQSEATKLTEKSKDAPMPQRHASGLGNSSTIVFDQNAIKSRDMLAAMETPDWLLEQENKPESSFTEKWSFPGFLSKWVGQDESVRVIEEYTTDATEETFP